MSDFKRLSDRVWASPQITVGEVAEAASQGFVMVVNNRPDGEADDQPAGSQIEQAAKEFREIAPPYRPYPKPTQVDW